MESGLHALELRYGRTMLIADLLPVSRSPRPVRRAVAAAVATAVLVSGSLALGVQPAVASELRYGETAVIVTSADPDFLATDDSNRVYSTSDQSYRLNIFDGLTGASVSSYFLGVTGGPLVVNNRAQTAYILSTRSNSVVAVDTETGSILFSMPIKPGASALAVDAGRDQLWVTNTETNTASVYDGRTGAILASAIGAGDSPGELAYNSVIDAMYALSFETKTLTVIDAGTFEVIRAAKLPTLPSSIAIDTASGVAYVGSRSSEQIVSVVSSDADEALTTLPVPTIANDLALDPATNELLVLSRSNGVFSSVSRESGVVSYSFGIERGSNLVANAVSGSVFVGGSYTREIHVLNKGVLPRITPRWSGLAAQATVPFSSEPLENDATDVRYSLYSLKPNGMKIDPVTGEFSGTPLAWGDFSYTVTARNHFGRDSFVFTLSVAAPPDSLPKLSTLPQSTRPVLGQYYEAQVPGSGYPAPTYAASGLPSGVKMSSTGRLTGKPKKVGKQFFTVTATNSVGSVSRRYVLPVIGEKRIWAYMFFDGKEASLDTLDRKSVRGFAGSIRKTAVITHFEIIAVMHNTGDREYDVRKAKQRAKAIAAYLKDRGVKAKPTITLEVHPNTAQNASSSSVVMDYWYAK